MTEHKPEKDLADLADAFRWMAKRERLSAEAAVSRIAETAPFEIMSGHYQQMAFHRAASLVENWMRDRGEPLGPTVEKMAEQFRSHP